MSHAMAQLKRLIGDRLPGIGRATTGLRANNPGDDPARCRRKFLKYFPKGFRDPTYGEWERGYKWAAHEAWEASLNKEAFRRMIKEGRHAEVAAKAISIESKTNLLFSFEKMALRDAVKAPGGAKKFADGLYDYLHGPGELSARFERWVETVGALPRKKTRVLTWPAVTVFGFIGDPKTHMFFKPTVTRIAARRYGVDLLYVSKPAWDVYAGLLAFAERIRRDQRDLGPKDMIDLQSFIWVQGSEEYS